MRLERGSYPIASFTYWLIIPARIADSVKRSAIADFRQRDVIWSETSRCSAALPATLPQNWITTKNKPRSLESSDFCNSAKVE